MEITDKEVVVSLMGQVLQLKIENIRLRIVYNNTIIGAANELLPLLEKEHSALMALVPKPEKPNGG